MLNYSGVASRVDVELNKPDFLACFPPQHIFSWNICQGRKAFIQDDEIRLTAEDTGYNSNVCRNNAPC